MMTPNVQEILNKINYDYYEDEEPYECDNKPNPFEKLTLDELLYIKNHQELMDRITIRKKNSGVCS